MTPLVAGWLALGIPLLIFGFFFLSRLRPVLLMYLFACMVGLGYLTATGAVEDLGAKLMGVGTKSTTPAGAVKAEPPPPAPSEYPTK